MSYMRGAVHIWADDKRVHIWAADGDDYWLESGWGLDAQESARSAEALEAAARRFKCEVKPSGRLSTH